MILATLLTATAKINIIQVRFQALVKKLTTKYIATVNVQIIPPTALCLPASVLEKNALIKHCIADAKIKIIQVYCQRCVAKLIAT